MKFFHIVSALVVAAGAIHAMPPQGKSGSSGEAKEHLNGRGLHGVLPRDAGHYSLPPNLTTTSFITSTSSTISAPTHSHSSQPPLPPPGTLCDPNCYCSTGGKPVPTEGRLLCGWCAAIMPLNQNYNVTDAFLCKDNTCCNYGHLDGRCETAFLEHPPNFEVWCPWPVQQVDPNGPPNGTTTTSSTEGVGTPIAAVPDQPAATTSQPSASTDAVAKRLPCWPNNRVGEVPARGSLFCGYCGGIETNGDGWVHFEDMHVCMPDGQCCSYGHDKRCEGAIDSKWCGGVWANEV